MKKLYFATTNTFKLSQAKEIFCDVFEIEGVKLDLIEIQTLDQKLISKHKAKQAFDILKEPVIVDDAGIFIKKYNNFPGVLTKYIIETIGLNGIMNLINENDKAEFKTTITYKDEEKEISVDGTIEGKLTKKIDGEINNKVPFNSIFKVKDINKLMKDLTDEELSIYSHRGIALNKLKEII